MAKAAKRKLRAASSAKKRASKAKKKKTAASARTTKASAKKASRKKPPKKTVATTPRGKAGRNVVATGRGRGRGDTAKDMDGDYQTCGGTCPDPKPRTDPGDPMGEKKIWCDPKCSGDVADACRCRLYSYPTPKPGNAPPPMDEWKKEDDDHKQVPNANTTYKCVCVRKKP